MPPLTRANRVQWWAAVLATGPGWIILGAIKQIAGGLLAVWILQEARRRGRYGHRHDLVCEDADRPSKQEHPWHASG